MNDAASRDPVRVNALPPPSPADAIVGPAVWLASVVFLLLAAGLIHRVGIDPATTPLEEQIILHCILALWPVFIAEAVVRFLHRRKRASLGNRFLGLLLVCVFPPARLTGHAYADPDMLWLPFLGWRHVDRHLRRQLERLFSIPLLVVALLVLPVVGIEYVYAERAREHFGLGLMLDIANSLIWSIFTLEFLVMISVAEKKLRYALQNWMDLAIVVLPLLDFLPVLRLLRLTRLVQVQQLTRMGRIYRLRGVLMKLWRAVLVLNVLHKLFARSPEQRLQQLREMLAAKEEETADLRREIAELENQIAATTKPPEAVVSASEEPRKQ